MCSGRRWRWKGLGAFFIEAVFLGLWMFGWGRLPRRLHLACLWIVAGAALLSAYTILVANSWMQHPVGYELVDGRARLVDVWPVLFNWNVALTTAHVLFGSLLDRVGAGARGRRVASAARA